MTRGLIRRMSDGARSLVLCRSSEGSRRQLKIQVIVKSLYIVSARIKWCCSSRVRRHLNANSEP